ncbi:MAG: hypothetical protein JKX93_14355 [Rhizobiaceae bacterium]|nr:hypothetical protein [Rhizobiaceae bacterium]
MALSQVQVIQSLAEALSWFEKELDWGVSPAELNHLTGRIGELYTAMITRGQMALETNQRGYDVISAENERISVKTITSSTQVSFNKSTFSLVDRVVVLRVNIDEEEGVSVETLLDCSAEDFLKNYSTQSGNLTFGTSTNARPKKSIDNLHIAHKASFEKYHILQYENGTISVLIGKEIQTPAKPELRILAASIGVDLLNGNGGVKNTRSLGADIIKTLNTRNKGEAQR